MIDCWKIVLLSVFAFGLAFGAERLFVPDIVPVAFSDEPQATWAIQTAFVLRALEFMTAGAAIIAMVLRLGGFAIDMWCGRRR
jgi:hypothetical protein